MDGKSMIERSMRGGDRGATCNTIPYVTKTA